MTRQEAHFDAMLKHLGAMYYSTLRGKAAPSDVAKALASVDREARRREDGESAERREDGESAERRERGLKTGRWRVRDVMTTAVISVGKGTPSTTIARLLSEHHINAMPVLTSAGKVAGVVSEADLLRTQHRPGGRRGMLRRARRPGPADHTAAQLMTAPAVTIHPDAPIGGAARRMTENHLTMLPVVDSGNDLIGVVSRRDLLRVFLRPDADIVAEVRGVLSDVLLVSPDAVEVVTRDGMVTLAGELEPDQAALAVRLAEEVDGVLAVVDKLSAPAGAAS